MVSGKKKRKIEYKGTIYYWYVRIKSHTHRIHIISGDKRVLLEYPFPDTEVPVTPRDIRKHLKEYHNSLIGNTYWKYIKKKAAQTQKSRTEVIYGTRKLSK